MVNNTFAPDGVREGAHHQDLWQKARALAADRRAARLQPWQQKDLLPPSRTADGTQPSGFGGMPPSAAGACPAPKGGGAGALDIGRPDSDPCEENLSGDERRWLVQGTIQSMPAPVREPSPARSRSPAPRREGIEAQPLIYDLMQQIREMWSTQAAQQGCPASAQNQWYAAPPPPPTPAPSPPPPGPERPEPKAKQCTSMEVQADMPESQSFNRDQQQEFRSKLQAARQLLPELRAQRKELSEAVKGIEAKGAELRQGCAEAEREGREDFEMLRGHLNSVESLKQAVLNREKDVRVRLMKSIDEFCQRVQQAEANGMHSEAAAAFRAEYPDLVTAADALCSRSFSLPQVDVPIDDIPFEARARTEKLRRQVVSERLLKAKDLSLWRLEQQRRQLQAESQEASQWIRHLGSMLDRYAEELGYICYFCSERFCAPAANTRCPWNLGASPRSGRHLSPDARVPSQLWGAGVHFWVPLPAASSAAAGAAAAGFLPPPDQLPTRPSMQRWEVSPKHRQEIFQEVRDGSSSRAPSPYNGPYLGPSSGPPPPPPRRDYAASPAGPPSETPQSRGRPAWRERLAEAGPLPPEALQARDDSRVAGFKGRDGESFLGHL